MADRGSQDWVISKIRTVRNQLWDVPEAALARYNRLPAIDRLPFNSRTIANVLNAYVLDEARRLFTGIRNSEFEELNGTTYHHLNGCVLWYKQLDECGFPSNYPTETALQMMQGTFPFMPQKVLLIVGYQLDQALQTIKSVVIQHYTFGNRLKFYIELEKVTPRSQVIEMPSHASDAVGTKTRVRIKRGPEQKELLAGEAE